MYAVTCRTNIDKFKTEEWPCVVGRVPMVGESVASKSGAVLRVVQITHAQITVEGEARPLIHLELHY